MSCSSPNKVVLVRQGTVYAPEYVEKLSAQIKKFNSGLRVITLTDQGDTPGKTIPLTSELKSWWAKLELFRTDMSELCPFLYLDLDTFVMGPLDRYFGGDEFTMTKDFLGCSPANSSVMWVPEGSGYIWDAFMEDPKRHMREAGSRGDQHFLGKFAQRLFDDVKSYRVDCLEAPEGTIIQFHGKPKPHECDGWAGDVWTRSGASSAG